MNEMTSKFRLLHTMIRVMDMDTSIDFYTRILGMKLLRRQDYEGGRFTLSFVGYGNEETDSVVELTHNWDQTEPYDIGDAFGHLAIAVPDAYAVCQALEEGRISASPRWSDAGGDRVIAFIEDPDGYKIELVQRD